MDANAQSPTPNAQLIYLGLGSNQGDRERNLRDAIERLRAVVDVDAISSVYETEPVGFQQQPDFLNIVVRARTTLAPEEVMTGLIGIERAMGRERTFRNAPRLIDIDLLLHGDLVVDMPELVVPHPRMVGRAFTLLPLIELDPSLRHPITGERLADVAARTPLERATRLGALGRGAANLVVLLAVGLTALLGACSGGAPAAGSDPELERLVAEILPRIEQVADMPSRAPIRAQRRSRDELRDYLTGRMAKQLPQEELERTELLYQELGLLPDTLELRQLMLDLLTEQVVGYYDPPTETLYLVEGASQEMAREVLAHELVHALQDQYVDLDSMMSPEIENDRAAAGAAAIEGHATLVMFALMLSERTGGDSDITEMPNIAQQLRPALEAGNDRMPIFRDAPRIIRETMIFPYIDGAGYVQAAWAAHEGEGRPEFATILPASTEQVIHARERGFGDERDQPTRVSLAAPRGDWRVVHEEVLGELELGLLLREHLGSSAGDADRAVAGWDGDIVRLVESGLGERALVIGTVWDSASDADEFAEAYRRVLTERGRHGRVDRTSLEGRELVVVVDAPRGVPASLLPTPSVQALTR